MIIHRAVFLAVLLSPATPVLVDMDATGGGAAAGTTHFAGQIRNDQELAEALRAAVLGDSALVLAELYRADTLPADLVPMVAEVQASMLEHFEKLRDLIAPVTCEIVAVERMRTSVVVTMLINGRSEWSFTVDDIYRAGDALRTHDTIVIESL